MRRDDFVAAFKSMAGAVEIDGRSDVQEITVSGDIAVCWNLLEVRVTPMAGGATVKRAGNTLTVFRRGDDRQWRIWRDANMLAPA
jgi:ketosteroid isomerase-like protein